MPSRLVILLSQSLWLPTLQQPGTGTSLGTEQGLRTQMQPATWHSTCLVTLQFTCNKERGAQA